mgnify:CR=1 FL=1
MQQQSSSHHHRVLKTPQEIPKVLNEKSRKIGILAILSPGSHGNTAIIDHLHSLDSRVQELSWGAAHLTGYQDALGKIQVGYRVDLLLIEDSTLTPPGPIAIKTVLIDGIPQDLETSPLKSLFWFWKTVSLGL